MGRASRARNGVPNGIDKPHSKACRDADKMRSDFERRQSEDAKPVVQTANAMMRGLIDVHENIQSRIGKAGRPVHTKRGHKVRPGT